MEKRILSSTEKIHQLQNRVMELEQQLAEAQATLQAQTALPGSSMMRRAKLLFTNSRDIILFIQGDNGRILDANPAARHAYGYSLAELLTLTIHELRAPDTQEQPADQMIKADNEAILFETAHQRKNGSTFPVEVSSQGVTINGERTFISVIRDISERKQAEAERERLMVAVEQEKIDAQHRAEELHAIIEALHDPVLVYNEEGVIYQANASAVRAHGFDPSRQHRNETNRALVVRYPDGRIAHSDELPSARALEGKAVIGEQLEITNPQGQALTILITSTPLVVNGAQRGAVSVWHDITEQERAKQALQTALSEAEEGRLMLEAILENVPIGLAITGGPPDFLLARVSQHGLEMNQRPADELLGLPSGQHQAAWKILAPDGNTQLLPEQMPLYRASRFGEPTLNLELLMEAQDGRRIPVLVNAAPVRDNQGKIVAAINTWLDISERKRAELALRKSEARYRRLIENANEGIWTIDADHLTDFINRRGAEILGYTVEEMLGKSAIDFVFPEDVAYGSQQLADRKQGIAAVHEMRMRHKAGQEIWVSSSATPIYGEQGEYLGALAMFMDINERRQAEAALRENEEMLRLALTAGRAGAWSWDLTTDILHWSDEYYRIFGFEPGSIPPSVEAGFNRIHPDDLPRINDVVRDAIERGTQIDTVHRVIWPDGLVHWVRGISRAFYQEQGKPVRMAGIAMDITEQKQAEIDLQAAHRRNIEILESISDAFYSLDPEGRFTYVNQKAASLWGKQPGELLGKNIWEVFPSGKQTESYTKIQQALADRQPNQYETYSTFLDQWIEVHLYPSEQGISVYFQEINERKHAEAALAEFTEKLARSNQELEQFAYAASHDLQEPLRKIEAFAIRLLESTTSLEEYQREYVERMRNAASRMRQMIESLLQLSRIRTQGQPFQQIDLSLVTAEVLSDLDHLIRRTGGRVEVGELPSVEGDSLQLHQLLQNLISNSLKFHHPDKPPVVKVYARLHFNSVQILIEDNGIGFDSTDTERIFQPFQRLVGRSQYEGSGMGLAICRRIVERHGGGITANSKPGQGATFTVTLPVQQGNGQVEN